jgi:hypothetical protein
MALIIDVDHTDYTEGGERGGELYPTPLGSS